jgi:hypothetical protein
VAVFSSAAKAGSGEIRLAVARGARRLTDCASLTSDPWRASSLSAVADPREPRVQP